jgi:hypothetical protein
MNYYAFAFNMGFFLAGGQCFAQLLLEPVASGLSQPVDIANAGDGSHRLFIVERTGRVRIIMPDGELLSLPFLDISDKVDHTGGEEGLLGLVFHPQYAVNGYFFVYYTRRADNRRQAVLERYAVSENPDLADPGSWAEVLAIDQPQANHNGGDLAFGPHGNLYIGVGDGGSANDPGERSQNLTLPLGKMLRINVDQLPYTIPADNPFTTATGDTLREIWAWGLRNPWRFSFDDNYDLWIGDVGQSAREEINFVPAESNVPGLNYGWDCREGDIACPGCGNDRCSGLNFTEPVYWYGPGPGLSVTGGYVMRGEYYDLFEGSYIFADYMRDEIRILEVTPSREVSISRTIRANNITTFGKDEWGRIYAANYTGIIYRIVEAGVLPVEQLFVRIEKQQRTILLEWESGFEWNASHFEIERSFEDEPFKQIGIVPVQHNGETLGYYQFSDEVNQPGHYLYRLKMMDLQGNFIHSFTLNAEISEVEDLTVSPNPASDKIVVYTPLSKNTGTLNLIGLDGKILFSRPVTAKNIEPVELKVQDYDRGLILVQFTDSSGSSYTRKLMLY